MEQNCVKTFEMQLNRIYKRNFCLKMYITKEDNLKFNVPSLFLKKLEHFGQPGLSVTQAHTHSHAEIRHKAES